MIRILFIIATLSGMAAAAVIPLDLSIGVPLQHRGSGWLHSLDLDTPLAGDLVPLHPRRVRITPDAAMRAADRATTLGVTVQVVLSDAWGYHADGDWPGDSGNWENWEKHVSLWARRAKRQGLVWEWDLWNEPDVPMFWGRSSEQHAEAWRRGVAVLRHELPKAVIVGPSTADNQPSSILAFLRMAQSRDSLPDVVSWHELNDQTRFSIERRIQEVRVGMKAMGLPELPIQINEYLVRERSRIPAEVIAAWIQLERAGVDGVKSCWPDLDPGVDQIGSHQITGLLTVDGRRRPLWWLFQAYGDSAGSSHLIGPREGWWILAAGDDRHRRIFAAAADPVADSILTLTCTHVTEAFSKGRITATRLPSLLDGEALLAPAMVRVEIEPRGQEMDLRLRNTAIGEVVIIDWLAAP